MSTTSSRKTRAESATSPKSLPGGIWTQLLQVEGLLRKDHAEKQNNPQRQRDQQGAPLRQGKGTIAFIRFLFGHNNSSRVFRQSAGVLRLIISWSFF